MPAQAQSLTFSCVTISRVPLTSTQSPGPCMTGKAPLPYEPIVIGLSAVPALARVSGPGQTPSRLKSTRSPAARVTLLTLPTVRQAADSLVPLLPSLPAALSTKYVAPIAPPNGVGPGVAVAPGPPGVTPPTGVGPGVAVAPGSPGVDWGVGEGALVGTDQRMTSVGWYWVFCLDA